MGKWGMRHRLHHDQDQSSRVHKARCPPSPNTAAGLVKASSAPWGIAPSQPAASLFFPMSPDVREGLSPSPRRRPFVLGSYLLLATKTLAAAQEINREPPNVVITESQTSIFHPCSAITLRHQSTPLEATYSPCNELSSAAISALCGHSSYRGPWAGERSFSFQYIKHSWGEKYRIKKHSTNR